MSDPDGHPLKLRVANARPQDGGRGVVRLPQAALDELGLHEGDVIEIVGKRHTAAMAVGAYEEDQGLSLIRLDGVQRAYAATSSGGHVEVRRAEIHPTTRVVVASAQKNVRLQGSGNALRRTLFRWSLVAGDVISTKTQRSGSPNPRVLASGATAKLLLETPWKTINGIALYSAAFK